MKLVFNEALPKPIRRALVSEAKRRNVRMNDLAGELLARHYGAGWDVSPRLYRVERAKIDKIRVPDDLHRRIREEAFRIENGSGTIRGVVLHVLATSLDTGVEVQQTRRPRKENTA